MVDNFYEVVVQNIKPWTPPAPSVRPRATQESEDDGVISGELPLKTVQRASTEPDWTPPDPVDADKLVYSIDGPVAPDQLIKDRTSSSVGSAC